MHSRIGQLPSTVEEWRKLIVKYQLEEHKLEEIRTNRANQQRRETVGLSGSTMQLDDLVFLRAIVQRLDCETDRAMYQNVVAHLKESGHINEESLKRAHEKLGTEAEWVPGNQSSGGERKRNPPPAEQFSTPRHSQLPTVPRAPAKSKSTTKSSNPLSALISAFAQKQEPNVQPGTAEGMDSVDGYKLSTFFMAYESFLQIRGRAKKERCPQVEQDTDFDPVDCLVNDMKEVGIDWTPSDSPVNNTQRGRTAEHASLDTLESARQQDAAVFTDNSDTVEDDPRFQSTDETTETMFIVSFFNALAYSICPRFRSMHSMAPERLQNTCGPREVSKQSPAYFKAAVDAHVESKVSRRFIISII